MEGASPCWQGAVSPTTPQWFSLTVASGHRGCHRLLVLTYDGWASEILHQLKTMVYTVIYGVLTIGVYLFPTSQVRVVRFYQSCSSPPPPPSPPPRSPPPPLPPLPCPLPPCQLFAKLFANFRTQWPLLDLNCKGLSALGTAGPQPGTFRAQWAPLPQPGALRAQWAQLDLNLGPSELSEHRWTSTAR